MVSGAEKISLRVSRKPKSRLYSHYTYSTANVQLHITQSWRYKDYMWCASNSITPTKINLIAVRCLRFYFFLDCVWNMTAHAQKPDFVIRRNGRVHLNRQERQFSPLLAAEVCASVVVMLDTPCSEVVWRLLATHSIRQFPIHFPLRASPCAITFQPDSTIWRQSRISTADGYICAHYLLTPRLLKTQPINKCGTKCHF